MVAWNVYLAILVDHTPLCAPNLIAYQRIITSASVSYSLQSWLNYDVQFRMLAASNPSLHWETRNPDLWLQCLMTSGTQQSNRWPCPFCGATTHFPNQCPFRANSPTQLPSEQWNYSGGQPSGTSKSFTFTTIPQVPQGKHTAGNSTIGHVNISDVSSPTLVNTVVPITRLRIAPGQDPCGRLAPIMPA